MIEILKQESKSIVYRVGIMKSYLDSQKVNLEN